MQYAKKYNKKYKKFDTGEFPYNFQLFVTSVVFILLSIVNPSIFLKLNTKM